MRSDTREFAAGETEVPEELLSPCVESTSRIVDTHFGIERLGVVSMLHWLTYCDDNNAMTCFLCRSVPFKITEIMQVLSVQCAVLVARDRGSRLFKKLGPARSRRALPGLA